MTAPFLNLELARRTELAEALAAVEGAETLARLRPGSGAAVERIGGGFAVYCGANSPITQAVGIGVAGAVSEEELIVWRIFIAAVVKRCVWRHARWQITPSLNNSGSAGIA